ncbi:MAG: acyltransferase family protein [Eubacterium sp.]|nr:acyltransferase family protein [Eubacterium sp.]
MESKQRDVAIDILKGLAIIVIVMWHADSPFAQYLKSFHVAVFFMASGYVASDKYTKNIKGIVVLAKKRIVSLYVPFVICNVACILFNNLLLKMHIYMSLTESANFTDGRYNIKPWYSLNETIKLIAKTFLGEGAGGLAGASWFLKTLLAIVIISASLHYIAQFLKKDNVRNMFIICCAGICLMGGYILSIKLTMIFVGTVLTNIFLYELGYMLHYYKKTINKLYSNKVINVVAMVVSICILVFSRKYGNISYANNTYHDPLIVIISALSGWVLLYNLAMLFEKNKNLTKMTAYIGRNTLPILLIHFLAFKVVTALQILIYNESIHKLAAFPVLKSEGIWWVLYAIVGIIGSLLLNCGYKQAKGVLIARTRRKNK